MMSAVEEGPVGNTPGTWTILPPRLRAATTVGIPLGGALHQKFHALADVFSVLLEGDGVLELDETPEPLGDHLLGHEMIRHVRQRPYPDGVRTGT